MTSKNSAMTTRLWFCVWICLNLFCMLTLKYYSNFLSFTWVLFFFKPSSSFCLNKMLIYSKNRWFIWEKSTKSWELCCYEPWFSLGATVLRPGELLAGATWGAAIAPLSPGQSLKPWLFLRHQIKQNQSESIWKKVTVAIFKFLKLMLVFCEPSSFHLSEDSKLVL